MRAVLFDLYGVLMKVPTSENLTRLAHAAGEEDVEHFLSVYTRLRPDYDAANISAQSYWRQVHAALNSRKAPGEKRASFEELDWMELHQLDISIAMTPDTQALEGVEKLLDAGVKVGLLSNIPQDFAQKVRARLEIFKRFEAVVMSCDIHAAKPDPQAFLQAAKALGEAPEDIVFFDDNAENIAQAKALGFQAHLFSTSEQITDLHQELTAQTFNPNYDVKE